jgi:hypothetical protein
MQMTGVYSRKTVEFVDQQAIERARALINQHPYSIATLPDFAAEYAAIYGADELAVLKASCTGAKYNMVQSMTEAFVVGGAWVPAAPRADSEVLKPGFEWQYRGGFGRVQIPAGSVPTSQKTVDDLTAQEFEVIVFKQAGLAMEAVLRKHGLIS